VLLLSNIPTNQRRKKQQMNNFRKIKKNAKALSPVVASIILIAVTVAVSVVVAAWMGGMTTGLMGNAEQATITNISFDDTNTDVTARIQNTGPGTITFTQFYYSINGGSFVQIDVADITGTPALNTDNQFVLAKGASGTIAFSLPAGLNAGDSLAVKMTTQKANSVSGTQTVP
jgi:archaeal type IV pilus assembly protein PilA